jgi:hypothetical protein
MGASFWTRFCTIVFPLLSPVAPSFCWLSTSSMPSSRRSASSTRLPSGGPQQSTTILVYKVYCGWFRWAGSRLFSRTIGRSCSMLVGLLNDHPVQATSNGGCIIDETTAAPVAVPAKRARHCPNGMVDACSEPDGLTHLGIIVFMFFPIWLAFVASTVTRKPIWCARRCRFCPGPQFWDNYSEALLTGGHQRSRLRRCCSIPCVMALRHRDRKDRRFRC